MENTEYKEDMSDSECQEGMKFIFIAGFTTIAIMFPVAYGIYVAMTPLENMGSVVNRWQVALKCNLIAMFTVVLGIQAVANGRAFKKTNNPLLAQYETRRHRINVRYLQNTLEQFVIFFVVTMTAAIYLDSGEKMRLLPLVAGYFCFFRLLFWIGYQKHWKWRAPGMVGTAFSHIPLLFYSLYCIAEEML